MPKGETCYFCLRVIGQNSITQFHIIQGSLRNVSQPHTWVEKGAENEYIAVFGTACLRIHKELGLTGK